MSFTFACDHDDCHWRPHGGSGHCGAPEQGRERRVPLVEVGPDCQTTAGLPPDLADPPNAHSPQLWTHDWCYEAQVSSPTKTRSWKLPLGKAMGGSPTLNGTVSQRGAAADYELWERLGNAEWSWDKVRPFFNRLELDQDRTGDDHDGRLDEYIWENRRGGYHCCGTCRIGPDADALAVVDQRLRVRAVANLFAADASVMPRIPSGYTNLATLMLGERLADWFRGARVS